LSRSRTGQREEFALRGSAVKNLGSTYRLLARFAPMAIGLVAMIGLCFGSVLGQQSPIPHTAPTSAKAAGCGQLADRLLTDTGYSNALRGVTRISRIQFQSGLARIPNLTKAEKQQIEAAFGRAFDADRLRASVRSHLVSRCDIATYNAVLSALASPLGQRMRRIEDRAGTAAGAAALRQYFYQLHAHPPAPERVALIQRLESNRHELEFLENLLFVMARETALGFGNRPPSDVDIRESMQIYLPMAKRMILLRGLGVYRDAPDQDLAAYSAMWKTAPFQKFNRILGKSFEVALGSGVRQAAQAVRPYMGKVPPRPNR
jgi:hypothetical protein